MRLIIAKDYADVSRKAANIIAAQIYLKPDCVLGLATGSSPVGTYKELIAKYEAGDLDFSKVRTVNLDEYVGLPKDHDQSYAYFMRHNLFDHVIIDQNNCNIPNGMNPDADAECARYDAVIDSFGGADLQLLGLGPNGHIGFNEPADAFGQLLSRPGPCFWGRRQYPGTPSLQRAGIPDTETPGQPETGPAG